MNDFNKPTAPGKQQAGEGRKAAEVNAFRIAQVAATLMSSRLQHFLNKGQPRDLTDPTWNVEFNSALKRAEMLMSSVMNRDLDIHAYQLFAEGEAFTEEQISAAFKRIGWNGLKSKSPVTSLMSDLRLLMSEHFQKEEGLNPFDNNPEASEPLGKVTDCLKKLAEAPSVQKAFPGFAQSVDRFIGSLYDQIPQVVPGQTNHEYVDAIHENNAFMEWCFPFEKSGNIEIRRYKPHEIFRMAANNRWKRDLLISNLSNLNESFVLPFPAKEIGQKRFSMFDQHREEEIENFSR